MPLLSRSEYNLILRSFDYYDFKMNTKEKELREQIEEKLYNNEQELSYVDSLLTTGIEEDENLELPDLSNNLDNKPVIENGQYISF